MDIGNLRGIRSLLARRGFDIRINRPANGKITGVKGQAIWRLPGRLSAGSIPALSDQGLAFFITFYRVDERQSF